MPGLLSGGLFLPLSSWVARVREIVNVREPLVLQLHKTEEDPQEYAEFLDLNR